MFESNTLCPTTIERVPLCASARRQSTPYH